LVFTFEFPLVADGLIHFTGYSRPTVSFSILLVKANDTLFAMGLCDRYVAPLI